MASASAIPASFASAISSLWNWKDHFSGDSITPSSDTNSQATTFLIGTSFVRSYVTPALDVITGPGGKASTERWILWAGWRSSRLAADRHGGRGRDAPGPDFRDNPS